MTKPVRLILLLFTLPAVSKALGQDSVLTINVVDIAEQTRAGVTLKCKEGCPPATSDRVGTAILQLRPENKESGIVELQIVKQAATEWVLISPWDGKWPVSKKSLTVVVARRGDRQILTSGKALEAVTARILKGITPTIDRLEVQASDEQRRFPP